MEIDKEYDIFAIENGKVIVNSNREEMLADLKDDQISVQVQGI